MFASRIARTFREIPPSLITKATRTEQLFPRAAKGGIPAFSPAITAPSSRKMSTELLGKPWAVESAEAWFKQQASIHEGIAASGGQVIAVTAQSEPHVTQAKEEWQLPFAAVLSDPTHKLLTYFRENHIFTVAVTGKEGDKEYSDEYYVTHKRMGEHAYPHGCAQPGVLVVGKSVSEELFNWHIEPAEQNYGGANDRPKPAQIWDLVQKKMRGESVEGIVLETDVKLRSMT